MNQPPQDTFNRNDDDSLYVATLSWRSPTGGDPERQVNIVRSSLTLTATALAGEVDTISAEPATELHLRISSVTTTGLTGTLFTATGGVELVNDQLAEFRMLTDPDPAELRPAPWEAAARPLTAPASTSPRTTQRGAQQ